MPLRALALLSTVWLACAWSAAPKVEKQVRIPVWVEPGNAPKMSVKINGADARVIRVLGPEHDLILLVVMDLVGDLTLVEPAREALRKQLDGLRPNELTSLLRAQDGLKVLVDPTADREAVASAISALTVGGKAGLLDTVEDAARVADAMGRKAQVRVAILYLTDSNVHNYREDFTNPVINSSDSRDLSRRFPEGLIRDRVSKLEASLLATETPLFFVHLAYQGDRIGEAYQNGLLQLTAATGGSGIICRSVAEIPDAISRIFSEIRTHSSVLVRLPEKAPRALQIHVESEPRAVGFRARMAAR